MLPAFGLLLLCQLAGEIIVRYLALPLPGPVLGLVLLAGGLLVAQAMGRIRPETVDSLPIGKAAAALLSILGLLFVPAGVGAIDQIGLFREHGVALLLALIGSTVLTLLVTVAVFIGAARVFGKEK